MLAHPRFLSTHKIITKPYAQIEMQRQYCLHAEKFGSFVTSEDFAVLQSHAIEIDISEELALLDEEGYLEVAIPALGIVDLFPDSEFATNKQSFATILTLNGLQHIRPDYYLATDIVGNQFEVLMEENGEITLPEEGTGLFSLISHITFIYSKKQITASHAKSNNKLLILPVAETKSSFEMHISVSHFNHVQQRKVISIREIQVEYQDPYITHDQKMVSVNPVGDAYPGLFQVKMAILLLAPFLVNKQLIATIRLEPLSHFKEELFLHGWQPTAEKLPLYTKRFGLSTKALYALLQSVYPLSQLVKDYLKGDSFGLLQKRGYNNFLLRTDAFSRFYDLLLHDLINQKLVGSYLFDRVSRECFSKVNLSSFSLDEHDKSVLHELCQELKNHRFSGLERLFLSADKKEPALVDFFHLNLIDPLKHHVIPHATLLVTQDNHSMNEIMESLLSKGEQAMVPLSFFENEDYSANKSDTTHLESASKLDEIDNFEGFDTIYRSRKRPWVTHSETPASRTTPRGNKMR